AEHFRLIEVTPGVPRNYFGLTILPHVTVHSIPTIGATFISHHKGMDRKLCIVGDNHSMGAIRKMNQEGIVRDETLSNLERIYTERFSMLVADGGAGAIHGNPIDSMASNSDRIVFVHVEELTQEFNTTFSLASSGKRYTIIDGDQSLYTSQVNHYLTSWLGRPFPNRWMRSLLAEEDVRRYNQDDVIIVQDAETRGYVYLILTGYCDVVRHDGKRFDVVANLQAGDVIGEMAIVTGTGTRNASVIARSPVTVCVFAEEIFSSFIESEGYAEHLLERWSVRPIIKQLPQFENLSSTSLERLGSIAKIEYLEAGDARRFEDDAWYILASGRAVDDEQELTPATELGWRPFSETDLGPVTCREDCTFLKFRRDEFDRLRYDLPQLNYMLRKYRVVTANPGVDWLLPAVASSQGLS
ncbi:MAG: cyclic nucleotide-binding domain-containing protein, partial [Pseudomonadales bacterium]